MVGDACIQIVSVDTVLFNCSHGVLNASDIRNRGRVALGPFDAAGNETHYDADDLHASIQAYIPCGCTPEEVPEQ